MYNISEKYNIALQDNMFNNKINNIRSSTNQIIMYRKHFQQTQCPFMI